MLDLSQYATVDGLNRMVQGRLPGLLGITFTHIEHGLARGELALAAHHLAPNGFLHAATVVALADTACGFGCAHSLPKGAAGFTTAELKSNMISTVRSGTIRTEARLRHGGRTTQVWDAEVRDGDDHVITLFRCTQIVLWPRP